MSPSVTVGPAPEQNLVSVRLVTDPPGKTEYAAFPWTIAAIHVGRAVYMHCSRGGYQHHGLGVHGDIDIVPANTPTVWEPEDYDTVLALAVEQQLIYSMAQDRNVYPDRFEIRNRFQIRDLQLENIGWALKAEMETGYPNGRVFRDSLATALAALLVNKYSSVGTASFTSPGPLAGRRLKQVLSYIEDNLGTNLSLSEIAAVAGVSVSHCKLIFRQAIGMSIHQYVIRRRVEQARALLCEGKLSISEIAQQTGFAHQSHLAKQLRRITGFTPREIHRIRK